MSTMSAGGSLGRGSRALHLQHHQSSLSALHMAANNNNNNNGTINNNNSLNTIDRRRSSLRVTFLFLIIFIQLLFCLFLFLHGFKIQLHLLLSCIYYIIHYFLYGFIYVRRRNFYFYLFYFSFKNVSVEDINRLLIA
ncbi:GSCOCG00001972001-RA-CDS [Cotesia congregata]|nr:GSCOCG00001972001-RA-CDS [Cotesia congregata]